MDKPIDDSVEAGEVFVRLLMEHEPRVRGFLRGLLPTWTDVDEVVQEASLIAWRKFGDFEQGTAFGGWFLTIARFEALKHRTRIARSPLVFKDQLWELIAEEGTDDSSEVMTRHLEHCLNELTPEKRHLLMNAHTSGISIRQIATTSGKSEQGLYKMVQRLRQAVLQCVERMQIAEGV